MEKVKKPVTFKDVAIVVSCSLVIAISLAVSGIFLFQHFNYTPFWVSGQSMYPTLNSEAKYADGSLIGEKRSKNFEDGETGVSYGFMEKSEKAKSKIKRFDIIVFEANAQLEQYNIKRVIALPGETFFIKNTGAGKGDNGDLYIKNANGEFEYIDQPISTELVHNGQYYPANEEPTTLGSDEYFVMGDNRLADNSYDSRRSGPVKKETILGVAKGLNGYATLGHDKNGDYTVVKVKHFWPRFFK